MWSLTIIATLVAFFATTASSQQYAGEVIANSLPNVPGAEIAFFNIPRKGTQKHTLINYYSHGKDGKRLVESKVQRAVIVVHGLNRDPMTYQSNMMSALSQVTDDPNINKDTVAIMAPYFPNGDDKSTGYPWTDGLAPGRGSTSSALVWKSSQWSAGGDNQYPWNSKTTSSYMVLDTLINYFDDKSLFPNMKQIVIAGHSLGAQTVQRYAAIGNKLNTKSPVTYWIGNPNSYVWLSTDRPLSTGTCPTYDDYRDGYNLFAEYPMTYGQSLVSQGRSAILANYQSKQIAYARGTRDNGDDSSTCAPMTTGSNRNERFFNFIKAFPASCSNPSDSNCDTVDFVNMGHDAGGMFSSSAGKARLFTDNFYGNGNRSYDFGYPRQQDGDDPFPDPALNTTSASVNDNTYDGNMTYAGCWSDSGQSRAFATKAYENSDNTIELCTSTCASRGFSMAGLEFGSQCYCGNAMASGAVKVIESSCQNPCSGNSSESCGGSSRLSVFSNGAPYVLPPASSPDTVGKFSYSNCYTDAASPKTLAGKVMRGNFIDLDYCADYCSDYKYFGTEYSTECFCGNTINAAASIASSGECGMTCANNTLQFCGGSNRLTLYTNPDWVQPTGSTTSSAATTPTGSGGSSSSGPGCPASDGQVVTSSNGLNFTVECGIDHQGGDLAFQYVDSFQQCIDVCAANSQCVDVSLSGTACYLKNAVGAVAKMPGIWGAKLLIDGSSSSTISSGSISSTASSSDSSSSITASTTATTTSFNTATGSPTAISCPASDGTSYTGASGQSFVIECGVDHRAGDMGNLYVNSLQQCIDACDQTTGCVDVSLSGTACYLKKSLGAAVNAPGIWGAKLVTSVVSSSSQTATASSTDVASLSSSFASSTDASLPLSSTATSASSTTTPTAVSCPSSDNTLYTVPSSSKAFLIECGIDHQGGDLSSKSVKSFAECIAACDKTQGCVDVSMSGDMCYLKSEVGSAVGMDWVWGAKLVKAEASATTTTTSVDGAPPSSSSSSSSSSTSSDESSATGSNTSFDGEPSSSSSSSSSGLASLNDDTTATATEPFTTSTMATASSSTSSDSSISASTVTTSPEAVSSSTSFVPDITSSSVQPSESSTLFSITSRSSATDDASSSTSTLSGVVTEDAAFSTISSSTSTLSLSSTTTETLDSSSSSSSTLISLVTTSSVASDVAAISSTQTTSSSTASSSGSSSTSASSAQSNTVSEAMSSASSSSSTSSAASSSATSLSSLSSTTSASSSTASSSPSSTTTGSLPAGFSYIGCFTDSNTRTLPESNGTSSSQTQQQCAMNCKAQRYKYSGTEYGNECWCGNTLPTSSAPESQCSKTCAGDATQKCGGGNRLSVVGDDSWKQTFFARESFESWNLIGCYSDSTSKRSLPSSVSLAAYGGGSKATIANCMQACEKKGFKYCGAEYYAECFGSNVAPATALAGDDPLAAGCNFPCKGNATESCGGSSRIIVYSNLGSGTN